MDRGKLVGFRELHTARCSLAPMALATSAMVPSAPILLTSFLVATGAVIAGPGKSRCGGEPSAATENEDEFDGRVFVTTDFVRAT